MLFNSPEYLAFFSVVLAASWLMVGMPTARLIALLLASYFFYAINNHWLIVLILISTAIDYFAAIAVTDTTESRRRKAWLTLSVATNLGILGYFKYWNFFRDAIRDLLSSTAGIELSWVDWNIVLPVGISFYTFQSMSYTIDVYRGHLQPERSWYRFAMYVAFFPQLIAGPIVRATQFLPQLDHRPRLSARTLDSALYRIFLGLFKKIILADFVAGYADAAFDAPGEMSSVAAWIGVYAFAAQIYFDFSGYTDIAIGSARLLGYELPENFGRPYLAMHVTEFWRRWHMSLSTWLRDYLYIPLGGNRGGAFGTYRNLMLTMLLGGLWHGAAWHFVLWGGLHGLLLGLERLAGVGRSRSSNIEPGPARRLLQGFAIFQLSVMLWIPFRAEDLGSMGTLLGRMFAFERPDALTLGMVSVVAIVAGTWLSQAIGEYRDLEEVVDRMPRWARGVCYGALFAVVVVFNSAGAQSFIYFQF